MRFGRYPPDRSAEYVPKAVDAEYMKQHTIVHLRQEGGQSVAVCKCGNRATGTQRIDAISNLPCRQPGAARAN